MSKSKTLKAQPARAKAKAKKETMKEIYARLKREFTAADLQKYTVIEKGIPLEKTIAQMEAIHRRVMRKKKK